MVTISLCMIVKNEEKVLRRCLSSIKNLMDEIIIVDTGSSDKTKEIAGEFTDKIYDFTWIGDFSAARNFAFSKATCEYIYSADADEVLEGENIEKFAALKQALNPEIELVQMYYGNQLSLGGVYNYDRELRPKLFKRVRSFTWVDPVHEVVRTLPVVFDSDIEITHKPLEGHHGRDLSIFEQTVEKGEDLSPRLVNMYARELFSLNSRDSFQRALPFFEAKANHPEVDENLLKIALCVSARAYYLDNHYEKMMKYCLKDVAQDPSSENCSLLGQYYYERQDYEEAVLWFFNAAYEQNSILNIQYEKEIPIRGLIACYRELQMPDMVKHYEEELAYE